MNFSTEFDLRILFLLNYLTEEKKKHSYSIETYLVCSFSTVDGGFFKCSGNASDSTLVVLSAIPSGKFRSIYSKKVDNVEPVNRWKFMK